MQTLAILICLLGACNSDGTTAIDAAGPLCLGDVPAVHSMEERAFLFEGHAYRFRHQLYGVPRDCPNGCAYSHACWIEDESGTRTLFYASWGANEEPACVAADCPRLANVTDGATFPYYLCTTPGLSHALNRAPDFLKFAHDEARGLDSSGLFNFCFASYADRY